VFSFITKPEITNHHKPRKGKGKFHRLSNHTICNEVGIKSHQCSAPKFSILSLLLSLGATLLLFLTTAATVFRNSLSLSLFSSEEGNYARVSW
jgi:hypothetical protein